MEGIVPGLGQARLQLHMPRTNHTGSTLGYERITLDLQMNRR